MKKDDAYWDDDYGYPGALNAAGNKVLAFKMFGNYSGEWIAKVIDPEGNVGYVRDWFGSCSGCDAFEAEFAYGAPTPEELAEFGRSYTALPQAHVDEWEREISEKLAKGLYVCQEDEEMRDWYLSIRDDPDGSA